MVIPKQPWKASSIASKMRNGLQIAHLDHTLITDEFSSPPFCRLAILCNVLLSYIVHRHSTTDIVTALL